MQTYQDLNNYGNTPVNYGSWQDYTIVFGNNAGNLSATEYENGSFPLYKQTPLTTFSDVSRDLLINLTFSNTASLDDVTYFGENPNISVVSSAANAYTVLGVRSVSDYDEAFGNVYVTTVNGSLTGFLLTTVVDDQFGNTRTWTANVSLTANPGFSVTSPITYDEDTYANITGVTINDTGGNATQTYTMTVSVPSAAGDISYAGGAFANSVTTTNTQSNITSSFSGNTWRFRPAADYTANTQATFNLVRTFDARLWTRTANLNIGNTHSEYSVPANITITEDTVSNLSDIYITDTRPDNINPAINYSVGLESDNANVLLTYGNVTGQNLTITGTKNTINSIIGNATAGSGNLVTITSQADFYGTANLIYSQTQLTDTRIQAANITIPVIVTPTDEFGITQTNFYAVTNPQANQSVRFDYTLSDTDPLANVYSIVINQTAGNTANILINGVNQGNSTTFTANRAAIQAANISSEVLNTVTGNISYLWSVNKTLTTGNVVSLVANVPVTVNSPVTNNNTFVNRNYTSNTSTQIFATNTPQFNSNFGSGNFTITVASNSGYFNSNLDSDYTAVSTWSYTGNIAAINSRITGVKWWPANAAVSGNVTANISLVRAADSATLVNGNISLIGTRTNISNGLLTTQSWTSTSTSYSPLLSQILYARANVLLVAGGGAASGTVAGYNRAPGGGGGVYHKANVSLNNGVFSSYTITAGTAGSIGLNQPSGVTPFTSQGGTGGDSSVIRTSDSALMAKSRGGLGGYSSVNLSFSPPYTGYAGNSGARVLNSVTTMVWGDGDMPPPGGDQLGRLMVGTGNVGAGGGGGVDGAGSPAVAAGGTGRGGDGYTSSITGTAVEYAAGGTGSNTVPRINRAGKGGDSLTTSLGTEGAQSQSRARAGLVVIKWVV